jgi:hypothetical protein
VNNPARSTPGVNLTTANVILQEDSYLNRRIDETRVSFVSNAVPAYLELELGVLEPDAFRRYQGLKEGSPTKAREFLEKQAAKVHIFRQRIPIRTEVP